VAARDEFGRMKDVLIEERRFVGSPPAEQADLDALRKRIDQLERLVHMQQSALLGALSTVNTLANLKVEVDGQAAQLLEGLEIVARCMGIQNLSQQIGVQNRPF
jgi:hypothetical protein